MGADGTLKRFIVLAVGASPAFTLGADDVVADECSVLITVDTSPPVALGADNAIEVAILFAINTSTAFALGTDAAHD
ncbi:hypothetical protein KAI87_09355 [Myxococcota bacterium]|nr:hypothetical protein [Myxococcota bacterium]